MQFISFIDSPYELHLVGCWSYVHIAEENPSSGKRLFNSKSTPPYVFPSLTIFNIGDLEFLKAAVQGKSFGRDDFGSSFMMPGFISLSCYPMMFPRYISA